MPLIAARRDFTRTVLLAQKHQCVYSFQRIWQLMVDGHNFWEGVIVVRYGDVKPANTL